MNLSTAERFQTAYRSVWAALHRGDDPDLAQHERDLLHHLASGELSLSQVARHLRLPASTTSVLVKDLARRGFLAKARDPRDERRIRITLTAKGRARVRAGSVLELRRVAEALAGLPGRERRALLDGLESLARVSERMG